MSMQSTTGRSWVLCETHLGRCLLVQKSCQHEHAVTSSPNAGVLRFCQASISVTAFLVSAFAWHAATWQPTFHLE